MGNLGKSSLAARVANRMQRHETVVLFERYDALAVFEALVRALPPLIAPEIDRTWRDAVMQDDGALKYALQDMLEGPFCRSDGKAKTQPILLIVDDLEQILEQPTPGEAATPVKATYSQVLAAIIAAFRDAKPTNSRLLLTSRYTFALIDSRGDDLSARLVHVPLPPMDDAQRNKQMRAAALLAEKAVTGKGEVEEERRSALEKRIKAAAGGNPGLQEILARPLLRGQAEAAEQAVIAVEGYLATGAVPTEASAAIEFFERVSLEAFRGMLTPTEIQQLRAVALFSVPVPRPVLEAAGTAAGVPDARRALDRLEGLGLIDLYVVADHTEAAVNPLARPLVEPLSEIDQAAKCAGSDVADRRTPPQRQPPRGCASCRGTPCNRPLCETRGSAGRPRRVSRPPPARDKPGLSANVAPAPGRSGASARAPAAPALRRKRPSA
jgi:hypothetical protein